MAKTKWQLEQDRKEHRKELMDQAQHDLDSIDKVLAEVQPKENPKDIRTRVKPRRSAAMPKALVEELDRREIETEIK